MKDFGATRAAAAQSGAGIASWARASWARTAIFGGNYFGGREHCGVRKRVAAGAPGESEGSRVRGGRVRAAGAGAAT